VLFFLDLWQPSVDFHSEARNRPRFCYNRSDAVFPLSSNLMSIRAVSRISRFAAPLLLAVFCLAAGLLWARSYWRVDKVRAQILPRFAIEVQLTPGRITFFATRSNVELSFRDSNWYSWPIDTYYADYIPPPSHVLFGEFGFYNRGVTIPAWFLLAVAAGLNLVVHAPRAWRKAAVRGQAYPAATSTTTEPPFPAGTLFRRDHPMLAVGPGAQNSQSASVMQVVS
jgi:hypothetical protein